MVAMAYRSVTAVGSDRLVLGRVVVVIQARGAMLIAIQIPVGLAGNGRDRAERASGGESN